MAATKTPYFLTLERSKQCKALEALIFASDDPLTARDLFRFLILEDFNQQTTVTDNGEEPAAQEDLWGTFTPEYFDELIGDINQDLDFSSRPFRIVNVGGGFQFATTPQYGEYVQRLLKSKSRRRLSQAALETLAIIAYKQPTTRSEIDAIRGVNSGEVVNALLEKNLVTISGRAETIGKPLLYSTTEEFLRVFGINKLSDLPKLREIEESMEQSPQGAILAAMEHMNKEDEVSASNEESENDIAAEILATDETEVGADKDDIALELEPSLESPIMEMPEILAEVNDISEESENDIATEILSTDETEIGADEDDIALESEPSLESPIMEMPDTIAEEEKISLHTDEEN